MAVYEIAGLRVQMDAFGRTARQAEPYLSKTSGAVDITLRCDPDALLKHAPSYGNSDAAFYSGSGAEFARALLQHGGLQLHASAVVLEGKAYLFTAPSGTGKSTHSEKWCRLFGAQLLNDDKPALRCKDGIWSAWGTPWSGKHDLSTPANAPVAGIAFLERGEENSIRPLESADAVPYIMSQCVRLLQMEQMQRQLTLLDSLLTQVPVWLLKARNDDQAAMVSRAAMEGKPWKR